MNTLFLILLNSNNIKGSKVKRNNSTEFTESEIKDILDIEELIINKIEKRETSEIVKNIINDYNKEILQTYITGSVEILKLSSSCLEDKYNDIINK